MVFFPASSQSIGGAGLWRCRAAHRALRPGVLAVGGSSASLGYSLNSIRCLWKVMDAPVTDAGHAQCVATAPGTVCSDKCSDTFSCCTNCLTLEAVRHESFSQVYFEDIISTTQQCCLQSDSGDSSSLGLHCAITLYLLPLLGAPCSHSRVLGLVVGFDFSIFSCSPVKFYFLSHISWQC